MPQYSHVNVISFHEVNVSQALQCTVGSPLPPYLLVRPHLLWLLMVPSTSTLPASFLPWEEGHLPFSFSPLRFPISGPAPSTSPAWSASEVHSHSGTPELLSSIPHFHTPHTSGDRFLFSLIAAMWCWPQPPLPCLVSQLLTKQNSSIHMRSSAENFLRPNVSTTSRVKMCFCASCDKLQL